MPMNEKLLFIKKRYPILVLFIFMLVFAADNDSVHASDGRNVTQNWAAAAVFYDAPSAETETFHMSEKEFLDYKTELETRLVLAYSEYYHSLPDAGQALLKDSQKAWINCYYSYIEALEQRWLGPVKIYFGVTGQERRTNVYREIVLLLLTNRITDLAEWNAGRFVRMEDAFAAKKAKTLEKAKKQLQVDMGLCLYVIQEEYREKIRASHRTFYDFLDHNQKFIAYISDGDEKVITAENLLQIQRMNYMTKTHYQGCRFFRREREE